MKVLIPESVKVKELVGALGLTKTRSENIKNKVYYFLGLLAATNENFVVNEKNDGYRNISSVKMRKIMGRKDYYLVLDLLTNPIDPVIESNNSWRSSKKGGHAFAKGFKLCQKYNTGEYVFRTIPKKYSKRIEKHLSNDTNIDFDDNQYQFLYNQFRDFSLTIDPKVYDYIYLFGNYLFSRVIDDCQYQRVLILNLIGRWLYFIEKIRNKDFWYKVSPVNHRLNSSITHLNRTLRPFILCNGEHLGMIDITASQPYLLTAVMNDSFLNENQSSFNLSFIYPEVFSILSNNGYIQSHTGNMSHYGSSSLSGTTINIEFDPSTCSSTGLTVNSYSFMWGQFLEDNEVASIEKYISVPFEDDLYNYLLNHQDFTDGPNQGNSILNRQRIKNNMMYVLFDDNYRHRNNNEIIKRFRAAFPGVDSWICKMHSIIGKERFSYLLQKTESHLVLDVISRDFHDKKPSAPIFTIHDAICTYPEYLPDLKQSILGHFQRLIGHPAGMKESLWIPNPEPKLKDIEEEWADIRHVKTAKRFEKEQHKVFSSNIERATKFFSSRGLSS